MEKVHVVIGAGGALGSAVVRRLTQEGRPVRALVPDADRAATALPPGTEIIAGGAMSPESIHMACHDAGVVYHCVNVPYHRWEEVMPAATENILAGARGADALLVFPGDTTVYGSVAAGPATEDHPHAATGHKGMLRRHLEKRLTLAHKSGECRVVIPRYPDFYGPNVTNRVFGALFEAAVAGKTVHWPGRLDVAHSLVFVDDAAAAAIRLADAECAHGQVWHVASPDVLTGRAFLRMALMAAHSGSEVGVWTRGSLRLLSLLDAETREMLELLYAFEEPMVLDGSKFAEAFPDFGFTAHEVAVRKTVEWFRHRADEDAWRLLPERGHVTHS